MIQARAKNGKLPLTVVRAGKTLKIELPVSPVHPTLAIDLKGDYPSYFVYGPVVFSILDAAILLSVFENNAALVRMLSFLKSPLIDRGRLMHRRRISKSWW